jgi:uncharacterized protein
VQVLLPGGQLVDAYDSMAWLSSTPFRMTGLPPAGLPRTDSLRTYPETNLRTYVRRATGRDGIWSLFREVAMLAARSVVGAPHHLATCPTMLREDRSG